MQRLRLMIVAFLRTPAGVRALWFAGTLGILAAIGMTGDPGLLIFVFEREMLALVAESAFLYLLYAWRNGALAVGWSMVRNAGFVYVARADVAMMRWTF